MKRCLFILLLMLCFALPALAVEDTLTNMPPSKSGTVPVSPDGFAPGAVIRLPGGRQTIIQEILPNGQWRTELGVITPSQDIVLVAPALPETQQPDIAQILPSEPEKPAILEQQAELPAQKTPAAEKPQAPVIPGKTPDQPKAPEKAEGQNPHYYTLAELLPKTEVPEKKEEVKPEKKPEKKAHKPEKKEPEKKEPEKKAAKKPELKKQEKPKVGQELRIPEHAAKTGNLDFLEGCWQGTRPEYYSKRTIKECFCFGAGGKTGKRRVLDYSQHRTCIGGSRATLSANGVLKVISSGAACNDGERWGQAEMVCRNSGPRTPCSWVFRDAQNGRQSYEIPFVRVESCGR